MNIKTVKEQIKHAVQAYLTRDEFGDYVIPIERQRPVFLIGPPGIGKTAIMEQIAQELGIGLVSYSMTHHTRQSAIGLPRIVEQTYAGETHQVSEYTMSEIIATVHDLIEASGIREGILFLDEINCVSETLAPAMLQFLQYKIFGRHRVPQGWIVVTAGNPPEYNNAVREFDIVTLDRLRKIEVSVDYAVWKEYAYMKHVHPSIMTYLEIKQGDFYKIETTVDGKSFVTARGWEDLSQMIQLYEHHRTKVDESLVSQFLQNHKIAKDFAIYYDLFNKYKADYQVDKILAGNVAEEVRTRAMQAKFDERLSLIGLLISAISREMQETIVHEATISELLRRLKTVKQELRQQSQSSVETLRRLLSDIEQYVASRTLANTLSDEDKRVNQRMTQMIEQYIREILHKGEGEPTEAAFETIKTMFDKSVADLKKQSEKVGTRLKNLFQFMERVFDSGQEILIFATELTTNAYSSKFISKYGSKEYFAHSKKLLLHERHQDIIARIEQLELE
jgi:shikimate kinase